MSDAWFTIGHQTLAEQHTGCTAILFETPSPAFVEVRGGAAGTRETALLDPASPGFIDGILLSGGSAFGLGAAEGVMRFLAERGQGYPAPAGPVPRVPAAIIYDLANGSSYNPTPDDGYAAAANASPAAPAMGLVGAGTGARVAKLGGLPGIAAGVGYADLQDGACRVTALVVLNALGDVIDPSDGSPLAGSTDPADAGRSGRSLAEAAAGALAAAHNTTIGAIMVSRSLDGFGLSRCAIAAHDALARCVVPAHTVFDGDTMFVAAPSRGSIEPVDLLPICCTVERAVERAITGLFAKR